MWPETEDRIEATMKDMSARAAKYGRKIDFGYRVHMVVRETEAEAREYARRLVSKLDAGKGEEIKNRALDAKSAGVQRQNDLRETADAEGYIEPYLWSGIGQARSGCGSAIVGDPQQVRAKLQRYMDLGVRAFIFSGYPLLREVEHIAKHVLPALKTTTLARVQGRRPDSEPVTPLTTGVRV